MFISFISDQVGRLVIDRATRRIRCSISDLDDVILVAFISDDRRKAIGFASDFQHINFEGSAIGRNFFGLQFSDLGQEKIVSCSDVQLSHSDAVIQGLICGDSWPSLWKILATDPTPILRMADELAPALRALRLENIIDDLINISCLRPSATTTPLVKALLSLSDFSEIRISVSWIAQGRGYPVMFDAIREYFSSHAPEHRVFAPHIDWGGPPECATAGAHTYGDPRILYYPPASVKFGRYCSIAESVTIILANHIMTAATTYPFKLEQYYWPSQIANNVSDFTPKDVTIGNDVWIGRGATILSGATIGDGAIIGADTVVRGDVPPYSIFVGNPGKVVRLRFPSDVVERFLRLKWWDWPDWKVDRHSVRMLAADPDLFLDAAEADTDW
ncbi:Acetyltransferase (isoleucine patch superfamily) [Methylobacterium sp. yr668]|nr:Acetyltransferase (isoleucine patch superfamily) [Methylobacterium sp. yr668]